jgi:GTPase
VDALSERFAADPVWREVPIFRIAAISGAGCPDLCQRVMVSVEEHRRLLLEDPDYQQAQKNLDEEMEFEIRKSIERSRPVKDEYDEADDDFDDFDD